MFWCNFLVVIKQQTTVTDKVKHRLEQLDDFEEVNKLSYILVNMILLINLYIASIINIIY